ncbi:MAG TPA: DNA primase regulatory subunit PriL [Thermoplasmatales archaeon]|nr:DNA primase regulatory subunit PriL [Thermoplasmatales archaeon]
MHDLKTLAKYPFLSEAKEYVKTLNVSVDELLFDLTYEKARIFGVERVENAVQKRNAGERRLLNEADYLAEILSYPVARMIVVCVEDPYFLRKYALGESVHAYLNLRNESVDFLASVGEDLGLSVNINGDHLFIYFIDYIRYAPTRYREWKMVNRPLKNGYVVISRKDFARLLQECLRRRLVEELESRDCSGDVLDVFAEEVRRFRNMAAMQRKRFETQPVGRISVTKLPPCMKDILASMQAGENIPHMGRFAFVAFLNALGVKSEEILKLFSTAPDYDEERTRYQVEHVTGRISSTRYAPPGCEKMRTYGLCPRERIDDFCKRVKNPVAYYRLKNKEMRKQ